MRLELVKDWMTREVLVVSPDTTVLEAGRMMVDRTIRRLPVMEGNRLAGIVTHGDVRGGRASSADAMDIWELSYLLSRLTIREIMTPNPVTIAPDDTIGAAAQLMLEFRIGGLPVLDHQGQLVGIITESDIFRLVARDWIHSQDEPSEPYAHYEE
jgi:acetoin utilization protein AcuB